MTMNNELEKEIGKVFFVHIPAMKLPYIGTLEQVGEKDLLFRSKDGKTRVVGRGMYDMEEAKDKKVYDGYY